MGRLASAALLEIDECSSVVGCYQKRPVHCDSITNEVDCERHLGCVWSGQGQDAIRDAIDGKFKPHGRLKPHGRRQDATGHDAHGKPKPQCIDRCAQQNGAATGGGLLHDGGHGGLQQRARQCTAMAGCGFRGFAGTGAAGRCEIALVNSGAIRGSWAAGTALTRKDMLGAMPFDNSVVLFEAQGRVIRQALRRTAQLLVDAHTADATPDTKPHGGFLHAGGLWAGCPLRITFASPFTDGLACATVPKLLHLPPPIRRPCVAAASLSLDCAL